MNAAKDMLFGLESVQPPLSSDTSSSFAHRSSSTVEQWRTSQPVKFDRCCGNDSITQDLSEACGQSRGFPPIALLSRLLAVNDCGSYFTEQIARNELDPFAIIGLWKGFKMNQRLEEKAAELNKWEERLADHLVDF